MSDPIFSKGNIVVDSTMVRFGDTTYPIANIGAVSIEDSPSSALGFGVLSVLIGGGMLLFGGNGGWAFGLLLIGAIMIWIGSRMSGAKLMFRTSSGNEQAFESTDKPLVNEIEAAIETAITERG